MRQLLLQCVEIEELIGKIYRKLATGPAIDGKLRGLLEGMAADEDNHGSQLRLASRLLKENIFAGAKIPRERIAESLNRARGCFQQVQAAPLGSEAAIALAIRLEKEFSEVHAHCAVEFDDPKMAELFRSLAWEDNRHAQEISQYIETRKGAK
ncbi:MAG: hypothetical protein WCY68_05460 [Desulfuromonadales bacterium]